MLPYRSSKGYTDLLFLALATLFGVLIAGSFVSFNDNPQVPDDILVNTPTPFAAHNSLQLGSFDYITDVPAPSSLTCTGNFNVVSNEPAVLYAWDPPSNGTAKAGGKIKVWATDEHSITIGSGNGATTSTANPDHANPAPIGDLTAKDCGPGSGKPCIPGQTPLPIFPAIFLVDRTANPNATSADALQNTPYPVNEVWGSWKKYPSPNDPPQNGLNVGGGDPFPAAPFPLTMPNPRNKGHETQRGAELIWNVDQLGLTTGHTYFAVFVVHDGDNNPATDLGIGCTTISY